MCKHHQNAGNTRVIEVQINPETALINDFAKSFVNKRQIIAAVLIPQQAKHRQHQGQYQ